MTHFLRAHSQIIVADSRPRDYRNLVQLTGDNRWHLHFFTTGYAAIRFGSAADLWIVNTQLPDMSGFDLFELLGERAARAPTFIVSDQYSADEERAPVAAERLCTCARTPTIRSTAASWCSSRSIANQRNSPHPVFYDRQAILIPTRDVP